MICLCFFVGWVIIIFLSFVFVFCEVIRGKIGGVNIYFVKYGVNRIVYILVGSCY